MGYRTILFLQKTSADLPGNFPVIYIFSKVTIHSMSTYLKFGFFSASF